MSSFRDKQGKVIVVDPSGTSRSIMTEVVRSVLGFSEVEGRPNPGEVLRFLEVENVSWILMPLSADQEVNAMHLLRLCAQNPELRSTRISLLVEESEQYCLQSAFEFGLLSYHEKPFTKESLKNQLSILANTLAEFDFDETLVASEYIRQNFKKSPPNYEAEIEFARSLISLYPGNGKVLLSMAEPQFHSGQVEPAKRTLASVKLISPTLENRVDELGRQLFGESFTVPTPSLTDGEIINVLGIESAIIIDSDAAIGLGVSETLKKLGLTSVQHIANGNEAIQWLNENKNPDLIIMEWRIPGLSANALLQRIRTMGMVSVPIIILSSLLQDSDLPLVREMGVAAIVNKPLNNKVLIPSLLTVMQQERIPTEATVLERKFRLMLDGGKLDEANELRSKILAHSQVSKAKRNLIEAEWAYAKQKYPEALNLARHALKSGNESYIVLNLLGKTFMRLADFPSALKCFEKAKSFSPDNIGRLVNIAETQAELGDSEAAQQTLDAAKKIDAESESIRDASLNVALASGDIASAKKVMATIQPIDGMISYLNNKAVAYARCSMIEEAINLYQNVLSSIPENEANAKSSVSYNLALAWIRKDDLQKARDICVEALKNDTNKRVLLKSKSLLSRLNHAMSSGEKLILNTKSEPNPQVPEPMIDPKVTSTDSVPNTDKLDEKNDDLATLEIKRGEMCCFLIFKASENDSRVSNLLEKTPRFNKREAISRAEALPRAEN